MLNQLAEIAEKYDSEICVEVLPRQCLGNCSGELLDILTANEKLKVCFDTNHLLKEDCTEFIAKVGSKIATLHVSDYDFVDEQHWLPGEGVIQWDTLYNALKASGYNGVWMYEVHPNGSRTGRTLYCDDFVRNAHAIFAGKPFSTE